MVVTNKLGAWETARTPCKPLPMPFAMRSPAERPRVSGIATPDSQEGTSLVLNLEATASKVPATFHRLARDIVMPREPHAQESKP